MVEPLELSSVCLMGPLTYVILPISRGTRELYRPVFSNGNYLDPFQKRGNLETRAPRGFLTSLMSSGSPNWGLPSCATILQLGSLMLPQGKGGTLRFDGIWLGMGRGKVTAADKEAAHLMISFGRPPTKPCHDAVFPSPKWLVFSSNEDPGGGWSSMMSASTSEGWPSAFPREVKYPLLQAGLQQTVKPTGIYKWPGGAVLKPQLLRNQGCGSAS